MNTPCGREHFNLYYIFKEEKEQKSFAKEKIDLFYKEVLVKLKDRNTS